MKPIHRTTAGLLVLLLTVAAGIRLATLVVSSGNLSQDVDAYRKLADGLAEGHGYSVPGSTTPTAFRPPLYPLLLAAVIRVGGGNAAIGLLHLLLSTATVWLTVRIGLRLGLGRGSLIPAALVALDPLLMHYTTFPMTETAFTFLVTLLLFVLTRSDGHLDGLEAASIVPSRVGMRPRLESLFIGLVFGLCALCRPTIWAFGGLAIGWWGLRWCRTGREQRRPIPWGVVLGVCVVVGPWLVRNVLVFGRPIFTTTHGGYTLLLGNNPVFYREVVDRPWGTVWQGESLSRWNRSLEMAMRQEHPPIESETSRDRWMVRRALKNIGNQPAEFLSACRLRLFRFWNVAPLGPAGDTVRQMWLRFCRMVGQENWKPHADAAVTVVRWGLSLFYGTIMIGLLLALVRMDSAEWQRYRSPLLLIAAFCVVHLFYWTNTRMRAPLIPAIALLAVRGFLLRQKQNFDATASVHDHG